MVITAAAAMASHANSYCPINSVRTMVSGSDCDVRLKMSGIRKLFHVDSSATRNTAMMPGRANGKTINHRTCQRSQPSTKAASSISAGMSRMKVDVNRNENGGKKTKQINDCHCGG